MCVQTTDCGTDRVTAQRAARCDSRADDRLATQIDDASDDAMWLAAGQRTAQALELCVRADHVPARERPFRSTCVEHAHDLVAFAKLGHRVRAQLREQVRHRREIGGGRMDLAQSEDGQPGRDLSAQAAARPEAFRCGDPACDRLVDVLSAGRSLDPYQIEQRRQVALLDPVHGRLS
jgi:hypothetical protein